MIIVKQVETPQELNIAHTIRKKVFVIEQGCPENIEWEFEEESNHYIASTNGEIAGTARWRLTEKGYKLERFAVLIPYRNQQVGAAILNHMLKQIPETDKPIYLHAQLAAKSFYLKHGFVPFGEHFWEGGIEHVAMKLNIR